MTNAGDAAQQFAQMALEYCELLRRHTAYTVEEVRARVQALLPQLYVAALTLQVPMTSHGQCNHADAEQFMSSFAREFGSRVGPLDSYHEMLDPYDPASALGGSLSADLGSIARDLADGLACWEERPADAIEHWRTTFAKHWGARLITALRVLHTLQSDFELPEVPPRDV